MPGSFKFQRHELLSAVKAILPLSAYHSSERKKSRQSARSMSLTPGSSTMELIGRFWRAPFQRQLPYLLNVRTDRISIKFHAAGSFLMCYARVRHENMYAMFGIFLVASFRFEHELLENTIVPRDDAIKQH